jgi:hypothetical protein
VTVALAALVGGAAPAHAYERSVGNNGLCLWWRQPAGVPVVANLDDGPTGLGCTGPAQVSALIGESLAAWGAATRAGEAQSCTSFRFDYRGLSGAKAVGYADGAANENLIVFRHGLCQGDPACGGASTDEELMACADRIGCWPHTASTRTIAITTTSYRPSTGEILDADMELHDHSATGAGYHFTCLASGPYCGSRDAAPTGTCVSTDAGSIVTHEAGHMLGLDHPPVPAATMYSLYTPGTVSLRELDADDVSGVCDVYPAGGLPATTCSGTSGNIPPIQEEPTSSDGGGCSTTGGGFLAMIALALALGRGARRQDTITPA